MRLQKVKEGGGGHCSSCTCEQQRLVAEFELCLIHDKVEREARLQLCHSKRVLGWSKIEGVETRRRGRAFKCCTAM